ncbi:MAG: phosphomannomutase [Thermoplasmata archaeon]|nr:MAG: phosphomannomutase [Thermoplasmata archaeon]
MSPSPFLAYDIRGRVGVDLTREIAHDIGLAYCTLFGPGRVVVGRDVRESSVMMAESLCDGLNEGGADVYDIGLCGTEEVYFAVPHLDADGGIMVTASHNPRDYNGMKLVARDSVPISRDNGLFGIRDLVEKGDMERSVSGGSRKEMDTRDDYIRKVISFLEDPSLLEGMRVVTDPGHGCAGPVLDMIGEELSLDLERMHHEPDGTFPAGVPNPLLPEMRGPVSGKVRSSGADLGVAWDGDFDRCFLFDENGSFAEGYYIVGLLAERMLKKERGGKIIHDPRLVWNTVETVRENGGIPIVNRTGHAFIKDRMRKEDAIYGGEMSAHHYFRDFNYCDTGMVPWLLVMEHMVRKRSTLSELLTDRRMKYPVSGEINRRVEDPEGVMSLIERRYAPDALKVDHIDGVSIEYSRFRFNLRSSNTEPLLRLNVEVRRDPNLLERVTRDLLSLIGGEEA